MSITQFLENEQVDFHEMKNFSEYMDRAHKEKINYAYFIDKSKIKENQKLCKETKRFKDSILKIIERIRKKINNDVKMEKEYFPSKFTMALGNLTKDPTKFFKKCEIECRSKNNKKNNRNGLRKRKKVNSSEVNPKRE